MRRLGLGSLKMLLAVTLLITGCHADKVTRVDASHGGAPTFRSNPSAQGPFRSVFLKYRADAPTDRLSRVMEIGGPRFAGDVPRDQVIAAYVPPGIIEALGGIPWVEFVSVGTDEAQRSALPAASAEQIPWGVEAIGADLVTPLQDS